MLKHVACSAAIAKVLVALIVKPAKTEEQFGLSRSGHLVAVLVAKSLKDVAQLARAVIVEGQICAKARAKARVGAQQRIHWLGITGKDNHQPLGIVFHPFEKS